MPARLFKPERISGLLHTRQVSRAVHSEWIAMDTVSHRITTLGSSAAQLPPQPHQAYWFQPRPGCVLSCHKIATASQRAAGMSPQPSSKHQPHPRCQAHLSITPSHEAHEVAECSSGLQIYQISQSHEIISDTMEIKPAPGLSIVKGLHLHGIASHDALLSPGDL